LEQKRQSDVQAELIRKQEALERRIQEHHMETLRKQEEMSKKQNETNGGIAALWEMLKKQ
jgi:hypothetical protein